MSIDIFSSTAMINLYRADRQIQNLQIDFPLIGQTW